jgi:uncharacterized protein YbjT (DUF2867 family)
VVRELLAHGEKVVVMTHSPEKTKALPAGAKGVVGNLREPASLTKAFMGVDAVFLVTAWAEDETVQGLAGVEAAKASSARRIVYLSIHKLEAGPHIPHLASKVPIEKAVKESGKEWTILRPNNFFQNDFWFRDTIMKYGVYPQPIGNIGLSRVDVRDIAEAAANALTQPDHNRAVYPLVGPDVCTGENTAATYSRYLGRQIRYGGDDLDVWFAEAKKVLHPKQAADYRVMYEHFQKFGFVANDEEFAQQAKVLGHPPRSFDTFVAEIAPMWKS